MKEVLFPLAMIFIIRTRGGRFRLVLNEVNGQEIEKDMPNLPVARVLWKPEPSLKTAAEACLRCFLQCRPRLPETAGTR